MTRITATPAHWASRNKLLISCATLAIATAALFPQKANAQAFQGSIGSTSGSSVTRTNTSSTSETITVGGNATINWSPTDVATGTAAAIDFLPSGNAATFTSSSGVLDYTVLNRIVPLDPGRPIALNGTVISTLQGTSAIGGNVWFYSPGGILVGASAVFNVGGLLLTTADPSGWSTNSNGFTGSFATSDPNSKVSIASGATINAVQQNSYVAVIAPRIEQGGTVKVDGSAAYVAANSLTMTMNQGLFDIQVDVGGGTDDPNGVVHTGSTTGGDTTALSTTHKVYIVAVPKNLALQMLLGGTIGFDANTAGYENGQIVLSSGWSINDTGSGFDVSTESTVDSSISIGPGTYLSDLWAIARGDIIALANTGGIDFAGNVTFSTYDAANTGYVTLEATNNNTLTVGGNVSMQTSNPFNYSEASILANTGGTVDIGGELTMVASGQPGEGGNVAIRADNGTINITGPSTLIADGQYFAVATSDSSAGAAFGGSVDITSYNSGVINTGSIFATAGGVGQDAQDNFGTAGSGYGGSVTMDADSGGSITVDGDYYAQAPGIGGNMLGTTPSGGSGSGGTTSIPARAVGSHPLLGR
jgi:hypothetical protein